MFYSIDEILEENGRRNRNLSSDFDPVSGRCSVGKRFRLDLPGFPIPVQYLPEEMLSEPILDELRDNPADPLIIEKFFRMRCRHDFPFWAATLVVIRNKGGGPDRFFSLNPPQRKLVAMLEEMRREERPIRLILLKARQWGGSTCIQLYIAWLQLVVAKGLNSLIIAHQSTATEEIKDMFDRMMEHYPRELLMDEETGGEREPKKLTALGNSRSTFAIAGRSAKIKLGTAERPDACRGADTSLIHLSEVGLWRHSRSRSPEAVIRAATSGVLFRPMTLIVLESTANGTGNYFHREYKAARKGRSQFRPLFIGWYEIPQYAVPVSDPRGFADRLLRMRDSSSADDDRSAPGSYLWGLWRKGATLEAIAWYIEERRKYADQALMASEYPSDDIEAFSHSGKRVFDIYLAERLRDGCRPPEWRGEITGDAPSGPDSLLNLRFEEDPGGMLEIWRMPERGRRCEGRWVVAVDIGGRCEEADWSVVTVFDRLPLLEGRGPEVAAQWRGHTDMDLLAWNAARIAQFFDNALLVIESNTLDSRDPSRGLDGDMSGSLFAELKTFYPNLYARQAPPDATREQSPSRYGFHTNRATKLLIITNLIKMVREQGWTERDERAVDELLTYERRQDGSFGAVEGCHDDLLMTRAIGLHIALNEMQLPRLIAPAQHRRRTSSRPDLMF